MKNWLLPGAIAVMVLAAPLYAHAQGIPDGIVHVFQLATTRRDRLVRLSAAQLVASSAVLKAHSVSRPSKRHTPSSRLRRCTIALT